MRIGALGIFACTAVLLWAGGLGAGELVELCSEPDLAIPDGVGPFGPPGPVVEDIISVPDDEFDGVISDVNVSVDITHVFMGDIALAVISPNGTFVQVSAGLGFDIENMDIIFDDEGALAEDDLVNCACAVQPFQPLGAFHFEQSAGDWTFAAVDFQTPDAGTLNEWCLAIVACPAAQPVVTCEGAASSVTLSWDLLDDSDGLTVLRDGEDVATLGATETSYTDSDLASGLYTYHVVSHGETGCDSSSFPCEVAVGVTQICQTPDVPIEIISLGDAVVSTIDVADDVDVTDVWVSVDVAHTWIGDLSISVANPGGVSTTLFDLGGGDSLDDDVVVTFADSGVDFFSVPSTCDCLMKPSGPGVMADLIGKSPVGAWELTALDDVMFDDGALESWCLVLFGESSGPPPCPLVAPELSCEGGFNTATLTWGAVESDGFTVIRDGEKIGDALGTATSFVDEEVAAGSYTYELLSQSDDPVCSISSNSCDADVVDPPPSKRFIRGDANGNGIYQNLPDPIFILSYQFLSGTAPPCLEAADVNGNGGFNALGDAIYGLSYAFLSGLPPPAPFPACGEVPEADLDLGCITNTCTLP